MVETYKLSENAGTDIITSLVGDELFFITQDPAGTPQTKLVTWDTLKELVLTAAASEAADAIADAISGLAPVSASIGLRLLADTSSTTDADPGAGSLRWNNATQASSTVLYLDDESADGVALDAIWPRLNAGGVLFLQHETDQDIWQIWEFTAINDASGYAKLTCTLWASAGSFADNDPMRVTLDKGQGAGSVTSVNGAGGAVVLDDGDVKSVVTVLTSGSTVTADCALGRNFTLTLGHNVSTLTLSNLAGSGYVTEIEIEIKQPASGGPYTFALPASFKALGGSDTAIASAANAVTVLSAKTFDNGTTWRYAMQESA